MSARLFVLIGFMMTWLQNFTMAQESITLTTPSSVYVQVVGQKVIIEAYKRIGVNVDLLELPAERAIHDVDRGMLDGVLNRIQGIESKYHNLVMIPIPINSLSFGVFTKNLTFPITGWKSLLPYTVAIRRGIKAVETRIPLELKYHSVTNAEQVFLMIDRERTNLGIYPIHEGLLIIKSLGLKSIKLLEPPLYSVDLYHYLHKKHSRLIPKITAALKEMEKQGEIKKIKEQVDLELLLNNNKHMRKNMGL
mgnify:CR=1 FL=1